MTGKTPVVSIVCPAYQEEIVLPRFHDQLASVLVGLDADYQFEVIYVDDGSTDATLERMRQIADLDPRVHYLSLSRNFGKEAALTAGLAQASGDAVISMDTDLQHPPDLIPKLISYWRAGFDIVRTERLRMHQDSLGRRLSAWMFHGLMRRLNGNRELLTSDYQLLSRRVVDALGQMPEAHRYVRGLVSWMGFPTAVVPCPIATRGGGTSKFTPARLLTLAGDGVLSFSRLPLRLSLFVGLLLLLLGLLDGVSIILWSILAHGLLHWEVHVLVALDLVLGGTVLCGVGLVGEYVGRIYEQVKQRPIYLLKEQSIRKVGQSRTSQAESPNGQTPWSGETWEMLPPEPPQGASAA